MKQEVWWAGLLIIPVLTSAQADQPDSIPVLGEVIIRVFEQDRRLNESAVPVNYLDRKQLDRHSDLSLLPALNSTPGVRLEERSPGSFRMNIRGSTVRSPFGIRNVKIYWNGIPFTDPGGSSYFNHLSPASVQSVEILKGPGGSLYGAGTGGVILLNENTARQFSGTYQAGSFSMHSLHFQAGPVHFTHQSSEGYREHSNLRRNLLTWQSPAATTDKFTLNAAVLYGDLYYQTPGALTKTEYLSNPKSARPAAGIFPSAQQAKAAIYQKTFLAGIKGRYDLAKKLENSTIVYGAFSKVKNPTFRNYERRIEPHFGARSAMKWLQDFNSTQLKLLLGGEFQQGYFNTSTFTNVNGQPDSVLTNDDINNRFYSIFFQSDLSLPHNINLLAGISLNKYRVSIDRLSVSGFNPVIREFDSEWAPRLGFSKKILKNSWVFGTVSKGFSPPTVQEILPSTSVISTSLQAEHGWNFESGIRSSLWKQQLYIEISAFTFHLKNAIVQRRDSSNADYFINAGSTRQRGLETQVAWKIIRKPGAPINLLELSLSHTWNDFSYQEFKQGTTDLSGRNIPSVSPHALFTGLDIETKPGIYLHVNWFFSDRIYLNDANTESAPAYHLIGTKLGWNRLLGKSWELDLFLGADNLLNEIYSLGNDINAAGGRYFNSAGKRNYFAGLIIKHLKKHQ